MEKITWYIYKFFNTVNGKIYIGQTVNYIKRMKSHKYVSEVGKTIKNNHFQYIHKAIKKYGNLIESCIIQEVYSQKDADMCEKYWINFYNSNNNIQGYNLALGGDAVMLGRKHTTVTKEKIRKASQGRIFTEEHKRKISLSNSGKNLSPEHKKKISDGNKGKKLSSEHKNILIASNATRFISDKTKEKMKKARLNLDLGGDKNYNSSITNVDAQSIRDMYSTKKYTQQEIANIFNIDQTTVSNIVRNKTYKLK